MYSPLADTVVVDGVTYNRVNQDGMIVLVPAPEVVSETRWTIEFSERELALVKWLVANVEDGSFNFFLDKAFQGIPYGSTREAVRIAESIGDHIAEATGGNDFVAYREFFQEWTRNA